MKLKSLRLTLVIQQDLDSDETKKERRHEVRPMNFPPKQDSISFTYFLHKLGLKKARELYNSKFL
jgi:hypothetical protein